MPRVCKFTPFRDRDRWCIDVPARYSDSGKKQRQYFKTKAEATNAQRELLATVAFYGERTNVVSQDVSDEINSVLRLLEPYEVTLRQVVVEWIDRKKTSESRTVAYVVERYLEQLSGKSPQYDRTVRKFAGLMCERFGGVKVDDLMPLDFKQWLEGVTRTPMYFGNVLRGLKPIFSWAVSMRFASVNPVASVKSVSVESGEPDVLSLDQVRAVLGACRDFRGVYDGLLKVDARDAILPVSLMLFAGIRPKEVSRLTWDDVFLVKRLIRVPAEKSKTGRLRLVRMEENLFQFLSSFPECERVGNVTPTMWHRKWQAVRKCAGIGDMQDVCRHTYASYWLAMWDSMDLLLQNMGHTTNRVTLKHYLTAAEKPAAEEYWGIVPSSFFEDA